MAGNKVCEVKGKILVNRLIYSLGLFDDNVILVTIELL